MMVLAIDVSMNAKQFDELQRELEGIPNGVQRVVTRAINKVGVASRTQIVRRIVREVALKTSDVRNRNVALVKANYTTLMARIRISGRRIPLKLWRARQTRRGVSYTIRRGRRKTLESAFMATMKSGHRGVFLRTGQPRLGRRIAGRTNRRRGWKKGMAHMTRPRLPIDERFGPSVPQVVSGIEDLSVNVLDSQIADKLQKEVVNQAGLVLQRRGRRRQ